MSVTTKIWRHDGSLMGGCGDTVAVREFKHWLESGGNPSDFPAHLRDRTNHSAYVISISPEKVIRIYENSPFPFIVEKNRHAMGSGRDFAFMAMRLGKSAAQAIELTMEFDSGTGQGVDTLVFE